MILVTMHMRASSRTRKELSQAITSLLNPIRSESGCIRCDFFHGVEDENFFCLLQEWGTRKDFEIHSKSENYKVMQGAMHF